MATHSVNWRADVGDAALLDAALLLQAEPTNGLPSTTSGQAYDRGTLLPLTSLAEHEHSDDQSTADPRIAVALRLIAEARSEGVALKLLGGIGCWLHIVDEGAQALPFKRDYHDIDLVVPRKQRRAVHGILTSSGLEPLESFNAVQGETRLMFADPHTECVVDVFLGVFSMCHEVTLDDDAFRPPEHPSLDVVELSLTKLQVVECNDKDLKDVAGLLAFHDLGEGPETVDAVRLARRLAQDWGLWRTVTENLDRLLRYAEPLPAHAPVIVERVKRLRDAIDAAPKSMRWRARARVGDRMAWYQRPDEPETEFFEVR